MNDTQKPTPPATSVTTTDTPMQQNGEAAAAQQVDGDLDPPLFSPDLISPAVQASLPEGYSMRPLRRSDYHGGKRKSGAPVLFCFCDAFST